MSTGTDATTQPTVKPKPKPADMAEIAKKAALSQSGIMGDGGGANTVANAAQNVTGGTPSAGCDTGSPAGTDPNAATDPNSTLGQASGQAGGPLSGNLAGVNPKVQNVIRNSVPAGCRAQQSPNGGRYNSAGKVVSRDKKKSQHYIGNASDTFLYCGGKMQGFGTPKYNEYLRNLDKNGAVGLAAYRQGFIHTDVRPGGKTTWSGDGADGAYTNRITGRDPGSAPADSPGQAYAGGGDGSGGGGGDPCAGGGSGGCQPVQSSAAQNAAAMAGNQGFDVSSMASMAAGLMAGGSPLSMGMGMLQQAIGAAGGGMLGQALALGTQALSDPAGAITSLATQAMGNMGGGIMPGIVGNLAPSIISGSGIKQDQIANVITQTSNQIFAKQSPPKLDRFISIFNAAHSAQDFASTLQETARNTANNVFGNAIDLFNDPSINNWANNPDYTFEENPYATLDDSTMMEVTTAVRHTISRSDLIGRPEDVLAKLIKTDMFNIFSSVFYNWDSYATRGFGTITNNVIEFGTDLKGLGKLADLNDLLRIGTPGQIAQQIILNGGGAYSGLLSFLVDSSLQFEDLSKVENDELVYEYLASVIEEDVVKYIQQLLEMDPNLNITTLGDLLDSEILFPLSYDYNYFSDLNDIAVFLSLIISPASKVTTLGELGAIVEKFEVPFDSTYLEGEPAIYDYDQITKFIIEHAPVGFFTSDGSLSIADFIGTAAGYIHEKTAPRIAELQTQLYEETEYFDTYLELLDHLTTAVSGGFYVPPVPPVPPATEPTPAYVSVPSRAGYSFGDYSTLDAAVFAIVGAIEDELTAVKEAIVEDEDWWVTYLELDTLHNESSMQVAREHKLRKLYGFSLGDPKKHDRFISDGVTRVLPLTGDINVEDDINIHIDGLWQSPTSYTVNENANTITLNTAPAAKAIIAVSYKTTAFNGIASKMQVWDFAANLENLALDTGFGRAADFLRRITTNDVHGQRITATLMNARNKARTSAAGLNMPNLEMVNDTAPAYVNYINWTSLWSSDPNRAAEIYLQIKEEVPSTKDYLLNTMAEHREIIAEDVNALADNIVRQLIFFNGGNIAMSDLMVEYYNSNSISDIRIEVRDDLFLGYSEELPQDGYILGPYKEIVSELCREENMQNYVFVDKLSSETEAYIEELGVDIRILITIVQRILSVSLAKYLGIEEGSFRSIFEVQSVSKSVIRNIANNI